LESTRFKATRSSEKDLAKELLERDTANGCNVYIEEDQILFWSEIGEVQKKVIYNTY
jgi:hypothetical protein